MSRIACIGSRETPPDILKWMEEAGAELVKAGHTIVSGNAPGADQAWARGGNSIDPTKVELILPWYGFEVLALRRGNAVRTYHGTAHTKREMLAGRNRMIVDGAKAVVGYVRAGARVSAPALGTAGAFKYARECGIPTWNVRRSEIREAFDWAAVVGSVFP